MIEFTVFNGKHTIVARVALDVAPAEAGFKDSEIGIMRVKLKIRYLKINIWWGDSMIFDCKHTVGVCVSFLPSPAEACILNISHIVMRAIEVRGMDNGCIWKFETWVIAIFDLFLSCRDFFLSRLKFGPQSNDTVVQVILLIDELHLSFTVLTGLLPIRADFIMVPGILLFDCTSTASGALDSHLLAWFG